MNDLKKIFLFVILQPVTLNRFLEIMPKYFFCSNFLKTYPLSLGVHIFQWNCIFTPFNKYKDIKKNHIIDSSLRNNYFLFSLLFWVLAFGCVFYLYRSAQKTEDIIIFLPILFLIPTFLFFFRYFLLIWWFKHIYTMQCYKIYEFIFADF